MKGAEGLALCFSRGEQAGVRAGEVGVVIAGMGDEFPGAGGQIGEQ